jgi:hypothetical protein
MESTTLRGHATVPCKFIREVYLPHASFSHTTFCDVSARLSGTNRKVLTLLGDTG